MLFTNIQDTYRTTTEPDILLFSLSKEQPELRLIGKGSKLNIYPDNQLWSLEGRFNVDIAPPLDIYIYFHPIKGKLNPTDMRDVLVKGTVIGPVYPKESRISPFLEGRVEHLYRVIKWVKVGEMTPIEICRKIEQPYKFEDLVKGSELEEISLSLTPTRKSKKNNSSETTDTTKLVESN